MFSAPHTATAGRLVLTYTLPYHDGTSAFTPGATLTGATSHATATIVSGGIADSGTFTFYNLVGTFNSDEILSDDGVVPGHAHSDGPMAGPGLDSYGQPSYSTVNSSISCRFFNTIVSNPGSGEVTYSEDDLRLMYPPTVTLESGDTVTGTNTGYIHTYTVSEVKPAYALGTLHHYTAKLTRIS